MINQISLSKLGSVDKYVHTLPAHLFSIITRVAEKMEKSSVLDSVSFVQCCVETAEFNVPDELWPLLGENTGIEVWSGGAQPYFLFSNLKFMSITSYTMDDIQSHHWVELFSVTKFMKCNVRRPSKIQSKHGKFKKM